MPTVRADLPRARPGHLPWPALAPPAAVLLVCAATLVDAAGAQWYSGSPVTLLVAAGVALWLGSAARVGTAATGSLVGAALLTAANQLQQPAGYSVVDDLTFFFVLIGGATLLGSTIAVRTRQLRELQRLSRVRASQLAAEVRATRLEVHNRVSTAVQEDVGQAMSAIVVRSVSALQSSERDASRAAAEIEDSARQALDLMRRHVGVLRTVPEPPAEPASPQREQTARPRQPAPLGWADLAAGGLAVPVVVESVLGGASRGPGWANVLAASTLALPLVVRRRHPLVATATFVLLAAAMTSVLTPLPATVSVIAPVLLVAYAVGAHLDRWSTRSAGVLLLWGGLLLVGLVSPHSSLDPAGIAPTLVWTALGFAGGVVAWGRASRVRALERILDEVEASRDVELRLAVAEQRQAVAAQVHDSVAAAMTVVCLHAAAGRRPGNSDPALRTALSTIEQTARSGLEELRGALDLVEPEGAEGLTLTSVVDTIRQAGVGVGLTTVGTRLPPDRLRDHLVARVVREALVNVARHAPGARAEVTVTHDAGTVTVMVSDEGAHAGVPAPTVGLGSGYGLRGMADRVATVGGELTFGPRSPRGFQVLARIPRRTGVRA